jgi:DNA-binding FadR family transcriptional regulator
MLRTIIDQVHNNAVTTTRPRGVRHVIRHLSPRSSRIYELIASGDVAAVNELWHRHLDDVTASTAGSAADMVIEFAD